MVLAFFGRQHTVAELRTLMRTDPNGTPVRRMTELTHLGFDVRFVTTDISGLATYLTSGLPPVAGLPQRPVFRLRAATGAAFGLPAGLVAQRLHGRDHATTSVTAPHPRGLSI
jgi:hypothetical protein